MHGCARASWTSSWATAADGGVLADGEAESKSRLRPGDIDLRRGGVASYAFGRRGGELPSSAARDDDDAEGAAEPGAPPPVATSRSKMRSR